MTSSEEWSTRGGEDDVENDLGRMSSGSTTSSGEWGTKRGEDDVKDDLEPVGACSGACAYWRGGGCLRRGRWRRPRRSPEWGRGGVVAGT